MTDQQENDDTLRPSERDTVVPRAAEDSAIEEAMTEALHAVEAREHPPKEIMDSGPTHVDAAAAVTQALIAARKELEEALDQTRKEASDLRDRWLRSAADFENYKKRMAREREDAIRFGNERLLRDLLPVLDDLDRALDAASGGSPDAIGQLREGVLLVQKKFLSQLERHEVQGFSSQGQAFDPNRHEAVQQIFSDLPPGTVASELQRGFLLSDRLLRPALVTVSMGPAPAESAGSAPEGSRSSAEGEAEGGGPLGTAGGVPNE